jgi:WD40 repeat protein
VVRLVDTKTGRERLTFTTSGRVSDLRYLLDGKALLTRVADGAVALRDPATGKPQETIANGASVFAFPAVISPDGRLAATRAGPGGNWLELIDWRTGANKGQLRGPTTISTIAFSPEGKKLVMGHGNGKVRVWDMTTLKEIGKVLNAHASQVSRIAFSPDGIRFATGANDGLVAVWDLATRERLLRFKGHTERVTALQFAANGKALASGSADGTARLWDLTATPEPRPLARQNGAALSLAFAPDGRWLATGEGPAVRLWDARTGQPGKVLRPLAKPAGRVFRVAIAPDGQTLAAGDGTGRVRLWDLTSGQQVRLLEGPAPPAGVGNYARGVGSLAFSPDGLLLAAGFGLLTVHGANHPQAVRVWEVAAAKELQTLAGHNNAIFGLAFSADGKLLATASDDGTARLWRVGTWEEVRRFSYTTRLESVALSPDGRLLAAGAINGSIRVWETATGQDRHTLRGHAAGVYGLAFSADGKTLASAGDRSVRLWDVVSGRRTLSLAGPTDMMRCLAFAPDGAALAAGSADGTIWLWRAATREEIAASLAPESRPQVQTPGDDDPDDERN